MSGFVFFFLFSIVLQAFQFETAKIETTFLLPPLTEATIGEEEIKLPPQIPDMIPKNLKEDIPKTFRTEFNRKLFELLRSPLRARVIAKDARGRYGLSIRSLWSLHPPIFAEPMTVFPDSL